MRETFSEDDAELNPFHQFAKWWKEALDSSIDEVNAMTLATADKEGIPTARIVLLKDYNEQGFVFFTNYLEQERQGDQRKSACHTSFFLEGTGAPGEN